MMSDDHYSRRVCVSGRAFFPPLSRRRRRLYSSHLCELCIVCIWWVFVPNRSFNLMIAIPQRKTEKETANEMNWFNNTHKNQSDTHNRLPYEHFFLLWNELLISFNVPLSFQQKHKNCARARKICMEMPAFARCDNDRHIILFNVFFLCESDECVIKNSALESHRTHCKRLMVQC